MALFDLFRKGNAKAQEGGKKDELTGTPSYMFFDTETNGRSKDKVVLQLGWVLTDQDGNVLKQQCHILKQDVQIEPMAMAKHRITKNVIEQSGIEIGVAYDGFLSDACKVDCIVGHNIQFDVDAIDNDLKSLNLENPVKQKTLYDTMQIARNIVGATDKNGHLKSPTLEETAGKLLYDDINMKFDGAHNALFDAELTMKCFFELRKREVPLMQFHLSEGQAAPSKKHWLEFGVDADGNYYSRECEEELPQKEPKEVKEADLGNVKYSDFDELISDFPDPSVLFSGKRALVTGTLLSYSRDGAKEIMKELGATWASSISKNVSVVVIGEGCGWKKVEEISALQEAGAPLKVINEETFTRLVAMLKEETN